MSDTAHSTFSGNRSGRLRLSLLAYFHLTKPRVIELLLITTLPAMILAEQGFPSVGLVVAVLIGGALAAGGANTMNCWIERDRDRIMARTRHRPLPSGDINPQRALIFGLTLEVLAFALLWSAANLLAALLALSATVFYIFVYTIWLKPRTAQNIVIGGAAGAVPALVGWAAVTGSLALPAWILFAIVFVWTPPHFWALAMRYRDDYAAAEIPMLPVVRGTKVAVRHILIYSFVVAGVSFALPFSIFMTPFYPVAAGILGATFIYYAVRLYRDSSPERAIKLFTVSNIYLALLFAAVAIDALLVGN